MEIKIEINKISIQNAQDIYQIMQLVLQRENKLQNITIREHSWVVALNLANKISNIELVFLGRIPYEDIKPAEILSVPLQKCASGLIFIKNSPSGDITPSNEDKDFTDRLIQTCRMIKVPLLDHIIITENTFFSYKENLLLAELERSLKYVPKYEIEDQIKKIATQTAAKEREKYYAEVKSLIQAKDTEILDARIEAFANGEEEGKKIGEKFGIKKGKIEGKLEGEKIKAVEIAKKLLHLNIDIEKIVLSTGLSTQDIEALK